mgnify:CR=1 FL=1
MALIAAPAIWPMDLRIAASPTAVMMPMRKAGTLRISFTRNWTMARAMFMRLVSGDDVGVATDGQRLDVVNAA